MDILHIKRLHYYQRCLFSGAELHVRYDRRVMAPNTHCSLFPIRNLCVRPCITWKLYRSYMDVLHIERLVYYWRHSLYGLELHERSNWRATAPYTHCSHSMIWYATMQDKNCVFAAFYTKKWACLSVKNMTGQNKTGCACMTFAVQLCMLKIVFLLMILWVKIFL